MEPIHRLILAIELMHLVTMALVAGLISTFIITVCRKTGLLEYLQSRTRIRILYNLLQCDFCIGFWLSLIITILAFVFLVPFTWLAVIVPPMAAAFNNRFLK
jgi:hypothetical protein